MLEGARPAEFDRLSQRVRLDGYPHSPVMEHERQPDRKPRRPLGIGPGAVLDNHGAAPALSGGRRILAQSRSHQ